MNDEQGIEKAERPFRVRRRDGKLDYVRPFAYACGNLSAEASVAGVFGRTAFKRRLNKNLGELYHAIKRGDREGLANLLEEGHRVKQELGE